MFVTPSLRLWKEKKRKTSSSYLADMRPDWTTTTTKSTVYQGKHLTIDTYYPLIKNKIKTHKTIVKAIHDYCLVIK